MAERAVPILPSRDLRETLAFYERLGFENRGAPPEEWDYLILGRGEVELHFIGQPDVDPLRTASSCFVFVDDADRLHGEWAAIGVEPDPTTGSRLEPPTTTDYGMREFALVDPSGNLVRVGSAVASEAERATSGLVQVAQHADDLDRAQAFYTLLLGTEPAGRFEPPGLLFYRVGDVRLLLESAVPSSVIYLRMDDLATTLERLRNAGVQVVSEPRLIYEHVDDALGPAGTEEWHAFVRDSEGNLVGLVELRRRPAPPPARS